MLFSAHYTVAQMLIQPHIVPVTGFKQDAARFGMASCKFVHRVEQHPTQPPPPVGLVHSQQLHDMVHI